MAAGLGVPTAVDRTTRTKRTAVPQVLLANKAAAFLRFSVWSHSTLRTVV